jgi:transcriptional regulator with XRE-family HTH domain
MDLCLLIQQRLSDLGLEQKDLATGAEVTQSYISQLLTHKKLPPAPERTDIYHKMEKTLKLRRGQLSKLADLQRKEELKRDLGEPPGPLLRDVRELILRKCARARQRQIRAIFEKEPLGEIERLVTRKLLDVVKTVAKDELASEQWLRRVARLSGTSYEHMRVVVLEFLDTDVFNISVENCVSFLDPMIESWDIDVETFGLEVHLNRRLAPAHSKKFEFVEREPEPSKGEEAGFLEFLRDPALSGDVTAEEIEFLKKSTFKDRRPTALYYYRELQNLRDPLHFRGPARRRL